MQCTATPLISPTRNASDTAAADTVHARASNKHTRAPVSAPILRTPSGPRLQRAECRRSDTADSCKFLAVSPGPAPHCLAARQPIEPCSFSRDNQTRPTYCHVSWRTKSRDSHRSIESLSRLFIMSATALPRCRRLEEKGAASPRPRSRTAARSIVATPRVARR